MFEFAAFLLPTNLGKPMHSPSALTEHVSLNLAGIFLLDPVLLSVTLAGYSSTYFWYTDMLRSLFAKQLDVTNMGLFWQFAENDLLDGLYWETWYNKGYKKADVLCPDGSRADHPCKGQSINDVRTALTAAERERGKAQAT